MVGNEIGLRLSLDLDGARAELMSAIDEYGFEPTDGGTVPPQDDGARVTLIIAGAASTSPSWAARAAGLQGAVEAMQRRITHHRLILGLPPIAVSVAIDIELTDGRTALYLLDDALAGLADLDPPEHAGPDRPTLHWRGDHWVPTNP